jgi:hypothetical protein
MGRKKRRKRKSITGGKQIQVELLRKKYARCLFTTLKIHGTITAFPCFVSQVEDVLSVKNIDEKQGERS